MTDAERAYLERYATEAMTLYRGEPERCIRAALAEIDRLKAEEARWIAESRYHRHEIDRLRDELAKYHAALQDLGQTLLNTVDQRDEACRQRDEARAQPSRPATIAWTRERPTEPGHYWMRGGWSPYLEIVRVEIYPKLANPVMVVWGDKFPGTPIGAEWAGPIPEPES